MPADDLLWVIEELVPVIASSSLKKLARITTDDNLPKFMDLAYESEVKLSSAIEVQQFETYWEAAEWIQEE